MAEILGVGVEPRSLIHCPDEGRNTTLHRALKNNYKVPVDRLGISRPSRC